MKKLGFTLSEVLITVGILGVVSAMTMPVLMNDYQEKAEVTRARKVVTELESAFDMYMTQKNIKSISASDDLIKDFVGTSLKTAKPCGNATGCFASTNYKSFDGSKSAKFECSGNAYLLANSAAICLTKQSALIKNPIELVIDTNGPDKPNVGGKDMFRMYIDKKGEFTGFSLITYAVDSETKEIPGLKGASCTGSKFGDYCYSLLQANNFKRVYDDAKIYMLDLKKEYVQQQATKQEPLTF